MSLETYKKKDKTKKNK